MRLVGRRGSGLHYYYCCCSMGILLFLNSWEPLTAFTWHAASADVLFRATTMKMIPTTKLKLQNDARCFRRYAVLSQDDDDTTVKKSPGPAMENDHDDNFDAHHQTMSKAKWKKKKFLMTRDVMTLIRNGDPCAPKKAQEMIHRMWTLYQKSSGDSQSQFMPDTVSYNLYINALAKCSRNNPTAALQAEQVLRNMLELGIRPNVVSYTSVMDAYAQQSAHDPTAAGSAERILFDLVALADTVDPTTTIANANANASTLQQQHSTKVTSVTADTVLNAWAQQGTEKGAARAQQILERLEEAAIHSGRSSSIRPTAFSYATVVHGWAQVGGTQGAEKAQEVLDRLLRRLAKKKDRAAAHPDTVVFNAVMHAWANSGDPAAGSKAVLLLNQMQELHVRHKYDCAPDTVSFNTVLSAWSHGGHMNAAMQAERILQEMVTANRQAPEHAPPPNTVSYNSVLHAWSNSPLPGAAERAEAVLEFMIRSKKPDIAPDVYSFASVLNALAKSKDPNKAQRSRARLDQLLEMYATSGDPSLRPSQVTFNTVLNGCAFSALGTTEQEQRDALQVAVQTFALMRKEEIAPDTVSYGNLIKCFANLMPQGKARNDMSMRVFEKCCEEGLVGELVWNEVRRAVPPKLLAEKMGISAKPVGLVQVRDLPRDCRRNVRGDKKAPPQRKAEPKKGKEETPSSQKVAPVQRLRSISEPSYQSGRDL